MAKPVVSDAFSSGGLSRRNVLVGAAALGLVAALDPLLAQGGFDASKSALLRVRIVTIGASQPRQVADAYAQTLGYRIHEAGMVSPAMAASWGTPHSARRPYFLLNAAGYPDAFVRVVGIDPVAGYLPSTTSGWNGFEFMVDDIDATYRTLQGSHFKALNTPHAPVPSYPTVVSFDVTGPASETVFLETDKSDRKGGFLPLPQGKVGRPHLAWVSGPDILKVRDWYADSFSMAKLPVQNEPIVGATNGATKPSTLVMMKAPGNFIEFSGDPAQFAPRPRGAGQLPPGNAMASFGVADLDALKLAYIRPPQVLYGSSRAATVLDPNGNFVELIEEARS